MRIPDTHEHTCAICNSDYVSFTSIDWGTCDNCENRARQYILTEVQDYLPEDTWGRDENGTFDLQEEILHDLFRQLIRMFECKFQCDPDVIEDKCQDQLYEIINNNNTQI